MKFLLRADMNPDLRGDTRNKTTLCHEKASACRPPAGRSYRTGRGLSILIGKFFIIGLMSRWSTPGIFFNV